jgi:hypothetical protein
MYAKNYQRFFNLLFIYLFIRFDAYNSIPNHQIIKTMDKQHLFTTFSSRNSESHYNTKLESILYKFRDWFRDFLDNAE